MKSVIIFTISMVIFGTLGAVIRFINLPSSEISLIRGLLGVMFLTPFLLVNRRKGMLDDLRANYITLLLTGTALAVNWILYTNAFRYTTIALATISYYIAPVIAVMLSIVFMKERISILKVVCIGFTLTGMVLMINTGKSDNTSYDHFTGILFGFSAAFCYASLMVLNKFIRNLNGLETTLLQLFLSALVLFPYAFFAGEMKPLLQDERSLYILLVLGVVHTGLGFLLFFTGIKGLTTQEIAILSYLDPLTSVLLSCFIFHERMTAMQITGAIMICGVTLAGTLNWKAVKAT